MISEFENSGKETAHTILLSRLFNHIVSFARARGIIRKNKKVGDSRRGKYHNNTPFNITENAKNAIDVKTEILWSLKLYH